MGTRVLDLSKVKRKGEAEISFDRKLAEKLMPVIYRPRAFGLSKFNPANEPPIYDADGVYYRVFRKGDKIAVLYVFHFLGQEFPPHPWDYEPVIVFAHLENGKPVPDYVLYDEIHYKIGYADQKTFRKRGYSLVMRGTWRSFSPPRGKEVRKIKKYKGLLGLDITWKDLSKEQREIVTSLLNKGLVVLIPDGMERLAEIKRKFEDGEITRGEALDLMVDVFGLPVKEGDKEALDVNTRNTVYVGEVIPLSQLPKAKVLGREGLRYLIYNIIAPYEELFPERLGDLRPLTDEVLEEWSKRGNPFYIREGWLVDPWEQNKKRQETWNGDPIGYIIGKIRDTISIIRSESSMERKLAATTTVQEEALV